MRAMKARLASLGLLLLLPLIGAYACGTSGGIGGFVTESGSSGGTGGASSGGSGPGTSATPGDDSGLGGFILIDSGAATGDGGLPVIGTPTRAIGTVLAPDCPGCTFPPANAPTCAANAQPITIVYPNDNLLVPPNMGVISVQWTPNGSPYTRFEVDFSSSPNTDWRIITSCKSYPTTDMQAGGALTGGCDLPIAGTSWAFLSAVNRGGNAVSITVRGTTDGTCASVSTNTRQLSFAEQDLLGTYYYWKSTISMNGVGGQIWSKLFGDPLTPESDVTSKAINATCNGCHALSRDGSRMVVYSDDDDSDDEYSDVAGSELDMTKMPVAAEFAGGVTKGGNGGGGQPPGFAAIDPLASYYVTSNGVPCTTAGTCKASTGYPTAVPTNGFALWNATNGTFVGGVPVGAAGTRPTMPDWSIDGKSVVYVQPTGFYDANWRKDDTHVYGGSLYTAPYTGVGVFGAPLLFLKSGGENNYYPSYSPDATATAPPSFVIFNRTPLDMSAGTVDGCTNANAPRCPNDSFSNPAARLMLIAATMPGGTPIDLEKANGSPAAAPLGWSNSYPRWAPFVQTYKGNKILWFTFSSTRDYGLRILNHKTGMYQCYPADSAQTPGASHHAGFAPQCEEPQLWMAPLTFSEGSGGKDPSFPAFWVPYQDMTTHNHTAQWTEQAPIVPPVDAGGCTCSMLGGPCGAGNSCGCCTGRSLICSGSSTCIAPAM